MPITFTADVEKFRRFPVFADRLMRNSVNDGIDFGQKRMVELVPKHQGALSRAVYSTPSIMVAPGHYIGNVAVDPVIAPHGRYVNEGTGVDGPHNLPVIITRPSRKGRAGRGKMKFIGTRWGGTVYTATVKIVPSSKIERGKNFAGRTYDTMIVWTHVRVVEIAADIAAYFARKTK